MPDRKRKAKRLPPGPIDHEAVRRTVKGSYPLPPLSRAEAQEVSAILTAEGWTAAHIAHRVDVVRRTIERWRAAEKERKRQT